MTFASVASELAREEGTGGVVAPVHLRMALHTALPDDEAALRQARL